MSMIADLKPDPEYKESGLPWLGPVPRHSDGRKPRQIGSLGRSHQARTTHPRAEHAAEGMAIGFRRTGSDVAACRAAAYFLALPLGDQPGTKGRRDVVSHGAVISLLVGEYNEIDEVAYARSLECPSFVVLTAPSLALQEGAVMTATFISPHRKRMRPATR